MTDLQMIAEAASLTGGGLAAWATAHYYALPHALWADRHTRRALFRRAAIRRNWKRQTQQLGLGVANPVPGRLARLCNRKPGPQHPPLRSSADPYGVTLHTRTLLGVDLDRWQGQSGHLRNAWRAERVRVTQPAPGRLDLRVLLRDPLAEDAPSPLVARAGDGWRCTVTPGSLDPYADILWGHDDDGHPVTSSLAGGVHGLIAGATRSGKSIGANTLLAAASLSRNVRLTVIDPNLATVAPWWRTAYRVTDSGDPDVAAALLTEISDELEGNKALFWEARTDRVTEFTADRPLHVVVIDELPNYTRHADRKKAERFTAALLRFASQSAKFGGRLWLIAQKPGADVLSTTVRMNLSARLCYRVDTSEDFEHLFPEGRSLPFTAADRSLLPGVGVAVVGSMPTPARFRSVYLPTEACWAIGDAICAAGGQLREPGEQS
jgi:S-DNA-T family DNA segregation ATPase FtsK/SpoIIIE